jgi:hypothetical protein
MWINEVRGTFEIERSQSPVCRIDETVKKLQNKKFVTDRTRDKIGFQRSIRVTPYWDHNRMRFFRFDYNGEIDITNIDGSGINDFVLNINHQLFKLILFIISIAFFLCFFKLYVNPVLFIGLSGVLILAQRELIRIHFLKILNK